MHRDLNNTKNAVLVHDSVLKDPKAWEALGYLHARKPEVAGPDPLKKPIHAFGSIKQYHDIFLAAAQYEQAHNQAAIDSFNEANHVFRTWVYRRLPDSDGRQHWLFVIDDHTIKDGQVPDLFPKDGAPCRCQVTLYEDSQAQKQLSRGWYAHRIDSKGRAALFKVSFSATVAASLILTPLADQQSQGRPLFDDSNCCFAALTLGHVDPTTKAELEALETLVGMKSGPSKEAFEYILDFKNPASHVNLFDKLPHLRTAIENPERLAPGLAKMVAQADAAQLSAYKDLLQRLPCGVGIVPGGPGGGKTFFNMLLTAMAQSQDLSAEEGKRRVKILYLIDINGPIDDAINKCIRLSKRLGDSKRIVRMFGWTREMSKGRKALRRKRDGAESSCSGPDSADSKAPPLSPGPSAPLDRGIACPSDFLALAAEASKDETAGDRFKSECLAPTLDQVAFKRFAANKEAYTDLDAILSKYCFSHDADAETLRSLTELTQELYADTLKEVDFLAATPTAATCLSAGCYKPDVILFDEAPHARELTTLIALAHFEPMAWIFTGDFRQTGCFVASENNPWGAQLRMSLMERAYHEGATRHELLMNHRAFAGLQEMPSNLFYDSRMVSGHDASSELPNPTKYLCDWMEAHITFGSAVKVPRALVHIRNAQFNLKVNQSFWNPTHHVWVMRQVKKLLTDPSFVGVDGQSPGTILIISPYRQATSQYKKAIGDLGRDLAERQHGTAAKSTCSRVEARSVDTVQGHEADFVFFDLVRDRATAFLDDPKRLAVATTRARQAEVYVMHPTMMKTLAETENLSAIYNGCTPQSEGGLRLSAQGRRGRYGQVAVHCVERELTYLGRFG